MQAKNVGAARPLPTQPAAAPGVAAHALAPAGRERAARGLPWRVCLRVNADGGRRLDPDERTLIVRSR